MPAKKKNKRPVRATRSAPTRKPPAFITPMDPQVVKTLPEGDDWIYELKFGLSGAAHKALQLKQVDDVLIVHAGRVMVDWGVVSQHFCRDRQQTARGSRLPAMSLHCPG